MVLGKLDWYMQKKKDETRPSTYTMHKKNSKWIKDLNVSHETIKILEENVGSVISYISHSNIIVDISPRELETKENKWN